MDEYAVPLHNGLDFYKLYGYMTTCRAYITIGDYDSAIVFSEKVLTLAEAYNRPLDMIEAGNLLSISFWMKRNYQTEAIKYLERTLSLAHSFGYTQLFVSDGAELSGMTSKSINQNEKLQFSAKQPEVMD